MGISKTNTFSNRLNTNYLTYAIILFSITITPGFSTNYYRIAILSILLTIGLFTSIFKEKKIHYSKNSIVLLFLNLVFFINYFISSNQGITLNVISYWLVSSLVYLYILQHKNKTTYDTLTNCFIFISFFILTYNIYILSYNGGLFKINNSIVISESLLKLHYERNNNFITTFMVIFFFLIFKKDNLVKTIIKYIIGLYFFSYILLSPSQTSKCLLVVAFISSILFSKLSKQLKLVIILLIVLLIGGSFYFGYLTSLENEIVGMAQRYSFWSHSILLIQQNFLFGIGLGNWMFHITEYIDLTNGISHAHNILVELCSEAGIIGITLLLFFILIPVISIIIDKKRVIIENRTYATIVLIFLISCLIYGVNYHQYLNYSPYISLIFICIAKIEKPGRTINFENWSTKKVIFICIILFLSVFSSVYSSYIIYKKLSSANISSETTNNQLKVYNKYLFTSSYKNKKLLASQIFLKAKSSKLKISLLEDIIKQDPFNSYYIDQYCQRKNNKEKYSKCLNMLLRKSYKQKNNLKFKLSLAEQYYLCKKPKKAKAIINEIRNIDSGSIELSGFDSYSETLKLKTEAYLLEQKYEN